MPAPPQCGAASVLLAVVAALYGAHFGCAEEVGYREYRVLFGVDRDLARQMLLNDSMCGAVRDFHQIEKMLDELLKANRRWLPVFFSKR